MKVELLGHEAEVGWISAKTSMSFASRDTIVCIGVWFDLKEPVHGVSGFGIEIPAREYTVNEFVNVVTAGGANALQHLMDDCKKTEVYKVKKNVLRKKLNRLVGNLGERLDVEFHLDI